MVDGKSYLRDMLSEKIKHRETIENALKNDKHLPLRLYNLNYVNGWIDCLNWSLSNKDWSSHSYSSDMTATDILNHIIPLIKNHESGCSCHPCVTNDVLQNYIKLFNSVEGDWSKYLESEKLAKQDQNYYKVLYDAVDIKWKEQLEKEINTDQSDR